MAAFVTAALIAAATYTGVGLATGVIVAGAALSTFGTVFATGLILGGVSKTPAKP
jgi:hypothetical protein